MALRTLLRTLSDDVSAIRASLGEGFTSSFSSHGERGRRARWPLAGPAPLPALADHQPPPGLQQASAMARWRAWDPTAPWRA
jgi:hypothetical protein